MNVLPRFDNATSYDLCFGLFGIPIRIHPLFWIAALALSFTRDAKLLLIYIAATTLSILIHELGHALVMKWYHRRPKIVLYMMGGYAQSSGPRYGYGIHSRVALIEEVATLIAGPLFPLLASAALALALWPLGVKLTAQFTSQIPFFLVVFTPSEAWGGYPIAIEFFNHFLFVSVVWGFVNLLPILPLDGGQLTLAGLRAGGVSRVEEAACWISIVTAVVTALSFIVGAAGSVQSELPTALFFLSLAGLNYRAAQEHRARWG